MRPEQQQLLPMVGAREQPGVAVSLPTESLQSPTQSVESTRQDERPVVEPEPIAMSLDVDPANRTRDRLLACIGLFDDAQPVLGNANAVPGAGVLCALPALAASGIFRTTYKLYGDIIGRYLTGSRIEWCGGGAKPAVVHWCDHGRDERVAR